MFSNKVKVLRTEGGFSYDSYVVLPRTLAVLQNAGSSSWSFIVHHYRPKYFAKLDKFYGFYFKVLDIFVSIHWPEQ